jgi:hypothetical protein
MITVNVVASSSADCSVSRNRCTAVHLLGVLDVVVARVFGSILQRPSKGPLNYLQYF